jgi:hypothetical protein
MGRALALFLSLWGLACAGRGESREGAQPITMTLSLRPVADGEPCVGEIARTIEAAQLGLDELTADGERSPGVRPARIEVVPHVVASEHLPPVDAPIVRAARRETLRDAIALVRRRGAIDIPPHVHVVEERGPDGWELRFVDTRRGFELETGALAKLVSPQPDGAVGVIVFLTEADAGRFEALTDELVGRRLAMLAGDDESLTAPIVSSAIPGGTMWITTSTPAEADELLARLVRAQ